MSDAERWRDFRHAAAEALDAAGIDGASRVVMNLPAPPATAPDAGGGAGFEAAVDALDKAAYAVAAWDFGQPSALGDPTHHRHAARAALLAAHAAELARVTAERDELRDMLADRNALATDYAKATAERDAAEQAAWHAGLDEGRAQGRATAATTPALVHGGPPRDSLDDGR